MTNMKKTKRNIQEEKKYSVRRFLFYNFITIGIVVAIVGTVVLFNLLLLGGIADKQVTLSQERIQMKQHESTHYQLLIALTDSLNNNTEFSGPLEASTCEFTDFITNIKTMDAAGSAEQYTQIESLHQELHTLIGSVLDQAEHGSKADARDLLESRLLQKMTEMASSMETASLQRTEVIDTLVFRQTIITIVTLLISILAVFVIIGVIFNVFRSVKKEIIHPVEELNEKCLKLREGVLDINFQLDVSNELGELGNTLNTSVEMLKNYIYAIDLAMEDFSNGNFAEESPIVFEGDFYKIYTSIEKFVIRITSTLLNISDSITHISASAQELSAGSQDLAQGSNEQTSSIKLLSEAIAKIKVQIQHNAAYTKQADSLSNQARDHISNSQDHMNQLVSVMEELMEMSEGIQNIVATIEAIASETNLLALNASIESARAGAAGRGFAVVANEIGKLAQESSEAVKNTTILIEKSLDRIEKGKAITENTRNAFNEVANSSQTILEMINKIAAESDKQISETEHIATGIEDITTVVQTNAAISQQSAAFSQELSAQTEAMTAVVQQFKLKRFS